jgi:DNA-binding phage protein
MEGRAMPGQPSTLDAMSDVSREQLQAYLDDALSDHETAVVEQALRQSEPLRRQLRQVMQERDRGEHSIGAVWRRERLTCPSREQLGSYLLQVLDEGLQDYVEFHLQVVGCSFCQANLADLQAQQQEPVPKARERRRRYFQSSAGYLQGCRESKS